MTTLGREAVQDIGNLYTASLPAWLAAGMEEAASSGQALTGTRILALGYGSGDAAEAIPMQVQPDWQSAASRIGFAYAGQRGERLALEPHDIRLHGVLTETGYTAFK